MFEKMMSLFAGAGRNLEVVRNEPSHIHIQRPSHAAAFSADLPDEASSVPVEPRQVEEDTPVVEVPAA